MWRYTRYVSVSMMFATRLFASEAFSASCIDCMKSTMNCESEVWYMQFTCDMATIEK